MHATLILAAMAVLIGLGMAALVYTLHWSVPALLKLLKLEVIGGIDYWHKLWSVRLALLSTVLGVVAQVLPQWLPDVAPSTMAAICTLLTAAAGGASLIKQPKLLAAIQADKEAACPSESKPSSAS